MERCANKASVFPGCVVAELFTEGVPLFDLSQLLAYRKGLFQTEQVLLKIEDRGIRELVTSSACRLAVSSQSDFLHKCFSKKLHACFNRNLSHKWI